MRWTKVKIGSVCEVTGGTTPSTHVTEYWDGDIPWLSPVDLPEVGTIVDVGDSRRKITAKALAKCSLRMLPEGSVVYSTRASIGKIGVVTNPVTTNQGFTNMVPGPRIYNRYLAYVLKYFTPQIGTLGNSTTFVEVSRTAIKNFEIPLPPLDIQRQISDTLDKADALRRKDQELLQKYDELAQSIFYEMFGGVYPTVAGDQCLKLLGGAAFQSANFVEAGVPVVRIGTINKGYFDTQQLVFLHTAYLDGFSRYVVLPGDLLMTLTGTVGKEDYGNVFVLDDTFPQYLLNQRVVKIEFDRTVFTTEYLRFYFKQREVKTQLTGINRGIRQANISNRDIYGLQIPVPPLQRQREFSDALRLVHASSLRISHSQSETLFTTLLSRYFA